MAGINDNEKRLRVDRKNDSRNASVLHDAGPATNGKGDAGRIPPSLVALDMIEMIANDPRPTFVIDLNYLQAEGSAGIRVLYSNESLRSSEPLKELLSGIAAPQPLTVASNAYTAWLTDTLKHNANNGSLPYSYCNLLWTAFTVQRQFGIISGTSFPQPSEHGTIHHPRGLEGVSNSQESQSRPLLTSDGPGSSPEPPNRQIPLPHHIEFFRNIDWAATSLGPTEAWSQQLRQMVSLLMSDPNPAFLFWTQEDMILVYNEAAIVVVAEKHPKAQGRPGKESFAEVWEPFSDQFASVFTSGRALKHENMPAHLRRHNRMDECYVTYTYLPITDESGTVVGIYETFQDVTRQLIFGRRLSMLLEISTCSANIRETKLFWQRLLQALGSNQNDVPFAILYSVDEVWQDNMKASGAMELHSRKICRLEGSLGIPTGHVAAPPVLDMEDSDEGYSSAFRKAMEIEDYVLLQQKDGSLPSSYVSGFKCRGFGEPSNSVVVCPIRPTGGENIVGFLILGLNPRQGFDEDERQFIDILCRQIATSVAAVVLLDEEIHRGRTVAEEAALGQAKLEQQLDMARKELMKREDKFEVMADSAPVGMVTTDASGVILYANKAYYDISDHPRAAHDVESWMGLYEDPEYIKENFMQLQRAGEPFTFEARLKKPWTKETSNGEILSGPTWILISVSVEKFPDGSNKNFRCTVTDISQQKWAEDVQKRRTEEAVELKRQQEAFIDMTSHEMRNPLSAIIQCADIVMISLTRARAELLELPSRTQVLKELIDTDIDAVETIILCARHQGRIIDDVLTLSKLDSQMLLITPVDFQPLHVIKDVMKMFEGEAKKHEIDMHLRVDESYRSKNIKWVRLDPSRLTQVLVNVLGNAVKFTQTAQERRITVTVSASGQKPAQTDRGIAYIPVQQRMECRSVSDEEAETETSEELFLHYSVQDTGRGLSYDERQKLFKRFGQASPRTHVEYGGSGLGLFISRELTEMQGGAIGFKSELGKGSTFAFYVRARRSSRPKSGLAAPTHSFDVTTTAAEEGDEHANKLAILVVEDNVVNQKVLCKQLRTHGHTVYAANHGGEALTFLRETRFWKGQTEETGKPLSVILMDTEMPTMDGLTCVREIRELQRRGSIVGHVPVISVTANARSEQIEVAEAAGMDDVVCKPFRVQDLVPKMQALVRRYNS